MASTAQFTFVSLACGSGGSIQGMVQAGGTPRFMCDLRPLEIGNAAANFPAVPNQQLDARWFYNRKSKGSADLLSKMGLGEGELDVLEGSVRFSGRNAASKALPSLYDLFGLAKRISPKFLIAIGPSDLLKDKNLPFLDRQVDFLRYASLKDTELKRTYYAAYRVLNTADFGAAVSKTYTLIIGVRQDIAQAHRVAADMAILRQFPPLSNYTMGTLGSALAGLPLPRGEEEFWEKETLLNAKLFKAAKFLPKDPSKPLWLPSYGPKQLKELGYETSGATHVYRTSSTQPVPDFDFYDPQDRSKWGLLHPSKTRVLTATEIAAAVGLPKGYKFQGTDFNKAKAAAETIPPALLEAVMKGLLPLLSPSNKSQTEDHQLPSDALKIQLAETLRSPASGTRTYHCDVDFGDRYARDLQGQMPQNGHFDYLFDANEIGQDFVVLGPLDPATGQRPVIGGVKRRMFEGADHKRMVSAVNKIKGTTEYRGSCSPEPIRQDILERYELDGRKLEISGDQRQFRLWVEETEDREAHWDRWRTNPIPSATEGWSLDKNTRKPQLSKTLANDAKLKAEFDYMNRQAEYAYLKIAPIEFKKQRKFLQSRVGSEYRLGKTVFTSLAINKYGDEMPAMNFHIDSGDSNSGLTSISVFNKGQYEGGYFLMPQFRCAFRVGDGDVFVGNSRKVHGVTQISGNGKRLSVVSYANTALGYKEDSKNAFPPKSERPSFRWNSYKIAVMLDGESQHPKPIPVFEFLKHQKIDPKRVVLFVPNEHLEKSYQQALMASNEIYGRQIVSGHPVDFFAENTPVVYLRADLTGIFDINEGSAGKQLLTEKFEERVIRRGFDACREYSAYLWGINALSDCRDREDTLKPSVTLECFHPVSSCIGIINRKNFSTRYQPDEMTTYNLGISHFVKDGRIVRFDNISDAQAYLEVSNPQKIPGVAAQDTPNIFIRKVTEGTKCQKARKVLAIDGVPATGKTTLMRQFLKVSGNWQPNIPAPRLKALYNAEIDCYVLGTYDLKDTFAGTDRLDQAIQPIAVKFIAQTSSNVIFEGDRLFNFSFLEVIDSLELDLCIFEITASPETLKNRHKNRKDNQSDQFLKSRETKIKNICRSPTFFSRVRSFVNETSKDQALLVSEIKAFIEPKLKSKPSINRKRKLNAV